MIGSQVLLLFSVVLCFTLFSGSVLDQTYIIRLFSFTVLQTVLLIWIWFKQSSRGTIVFPKILLYILLVYLASLVLSLINAISIVRGIYELQNLLLFVLTVIIVLYGIREHRAHTFTLIKYALCTVLLIYILVGVYQVLQLEGFSKKELYAVKSLFANKNLLSAWLLLGIAAISYLRVKGELSNSISAFFLIVCTALIGFLQTRSVLLGLMVSSCVVLLYFLYRSNLKFKNPLIFLAVGVLFGLAMSSPLAQYTDSLLQSETAQERFMLWESSLELIKANPILGVGAGNWAIMFPSIGLPNIDGVLTVNIIFQKAHNEYLEKLAEQGILGLISYVSIFLYLIYLAFHWVNRQDRSWFTAALLIALLSYCVVMFLDFPNSRAVHLVALGVIFALLISENSEHDESVQKFELRKTHLSLLLIILISSGIISIYRYQGEAACMSMLSSWKADKHRQVIDNAETAHNPFYQYTHLTMPIDWYGGSSHFNLGNYDQALVKFEAAYKLHPFNFHVLNNLAISVSGQNIERAKALLEEAVRINPKFDNGRSNLIKLLIKQEKMDEAKVHLEKLTDRDVINELYK